MTWEEVDEYIKAQKNRLYFSTIGNQRIDPEDVMQDARIRLFKRFKGDYSLVPKAYITRVIANCMVDAKRKHRHIEMERNVDWVDSDDDEDHTNSKRPNSRVSMFATCTEPSDDGGIGDIIENMSMDQILEVLPSKPKEAMLLRLAGYKKSVAADILGVKTACYESRIEKAKKILRSHYAE